MEIECYFAVVLPPLRDIDSYANFCEILLKLSHQLGQHRYDKFAVMHNVPTFFYNLCFRPVATARVGPVCVNSCCSRISYCVYYNCYVYNKCLAFFLHCIWDLGFGINKCTTSMGPNIYTSIQ